MLLDHVRDSDVLLLLQSRGLLTRPYCLLELHAAIDGGVPIVAINVRHADKGYDYGNALQLLRDLDTELDKANPGAASVLLEHGVDPEEAAWKLSSVVPNIISVSFDPAGSANNIRASLLDILDAMKAARPIAPKDTLEEFVAARPKRSVTRYLGFYAFLMQLGFGVASQYSSARYQNHGTFWATIETPPAAAFAATVLAARLGAVFGVGILSDVVGRRPVMLGASLLHAAFRLFHRAWLVATRMDVAKRAAGRLAGPASTDVTVVFGLVPVRNAAWINVSPYLLWGFISLHRALVQAMIMDLLRHSSLHASEVLGLPAAIGVWGSFGWAVGMGIAQSLRGRDVRAFRMQAHAVAAARVGPVQQRDEEDVGTECARRSSFGSGCVCASVPRWRHRPRAYAPRSGWRSCPRH